MHKEFEAYLALEITKSIESDLDHLKKGIARSVSRRKREERSDAIWSILKILIPLAIIFTSAVVSHYLEAHDPNEPTEEKVVENVAEGSAEAAAFEPYIPSEADQITAVFYAYLGQEFTVTHYCGCSICCGKWSSGSESEAHGCKGDKLVPYYSIAADPDVIPYGTIVHDQDGNEYKVVDTGSAIKGNKIDLFIGDHQEALNLGVKTIYLYW